MVKSVCVRCYLFGLRLFILYLIGVNGLIEIIEEQKCHNSEFRLTCRELDTHIAVLEAWYTSLEDYRRSPNATRAVDGQRLRMASDPNLDLYKYSSSKHNGLYKPMNHSFSENIASVVNSDFSVSDANVTNDYYNFLNDSVDIVMELHVRESCRSLSFTRSYPRWRDSTGSRWPVAKEVSVDLHSPVNFRCDHLNHCSFLLLRDFPTSTSWVAGVVYIKYRCSNEIVEEQKCHNYEFRLTCRDLDTHIAVLEAWYTSLEDYWGSVNATQTLDSLSLRTENDSELDQVYMYSSPKHNGVYESMNRSIFENVTSVVNSDFETNNLSQVRNDSGLDILNSINNSLGFLNDSIDIAMDTLNVSEKCDALTFSRSYGSWREGDKRIRPVSREASINLRAPLSYRCTGVNHCSFVLSEDYPPSTKWSAGVVYIKYACFDDSLSIHYCNREVQIAEWGADGEGYIRSPGYPHFYVGDECRWRLKVNSQQRVRLTLLDVSLRSIGPFEDECTDYVSVKDLNGDLLFSSCEQVELPLQLTSRTNVVDVVVEVKSQGAYPKRGVLLHYKSFGCVTLSAPSNGYLVYRNEDVAHYVCNMNYVFSDTRQRARLLWCYNDNRWNDTVPPCIIEETVHLSELNDSAPGSNNTDVKLPANEANMIVDIVIPSLLIVALFIGNAFIVLIIYKYRKRSENIEENTLSVEVEEVKEMN